jgi:hypothetical protein
VSPLALSLNQWADIAQMIAGAGVALVVVQIGLGLRNSRIELVTGLTALIGEVDRVFIESPHMWKYFNDCEPAPRKGDPEGDKVHAIAMTMANVLDHIVAHRRRLRGETRESWMRYVAEVYEKSPAFRDLLAEHETWWPGLQTQIRDAAIVPCTSKATGARPAASSP